MDQDLNNVSAFSAYSAQSPPAAIKKKPAAKKPVSAANSSFAKLTHDQMIAELISKKKEEMKRKSEAPEPAPKKTKKSKKVAPDAPKPQHNGSHNAPAIKLHPKDPDRMSLYLSKRNTKRNTKDIAKDIKIVDAAAAAAPNLTVAEPTSDDFVDLAQSTPIVPAKQKAAARRKSVSATKTRPTANVSRDQKAELALALCPPENGKGSAAAAAAPLSDVGSIEAGRDLLAWIIHPTTYDDFMATAWEQTPLLIARACPSYYSQLLSTAVFDRMLREQRVEFTKNVDITSYVDGVRKTHNPEGRAMPPTVWNFYQQGCSIRLLNPQTFLPVMHSLNATLQEHFQCMTGANVYLTPANSQGFAPHYDDIEAFVLQIEGKKHWKVYKPRSVAEQLPRESSPNFAQSEIGAPILDVVLEAGDLLYFPRGYIHQATTVPGHHSMHVTLSAYQKNSYADLLEQLVPAMLQSTIEQAVLLRRGLPANIWQSMGLVHSDVDDDDNASANNEAAATRRAVLAQVRACLDLTMKSLEEHVDDAVDKLAVRFQHDALPPYLSAAERARSVYGSASSAALVKRSTTAVVAPLPQLSTPVRLVRANILRMVRHSADEFRIYYHTDNSREYHELEPTYVEIDADDAPAVEYLVKAYPAFSLPSDWPIESDDQCLVVAHELWERGLLVVQDVLQ